MKAAYITEQGTPEKFQIGDLPTPTAGPGQVLVRVHASGVNPIDTYIRGGAIPLPVEFPYIPGCDLAGVVESIGEGVTNFQPGDRVWASNQSLFGRQGTLAEHIAVDSEWLYPMPEGMTYDQAAGMALVGITAHLGLHLHANIQPGEIVFVNGGTGGVGSMVIQLAKAAGAKVIATAGTEEKRAKCAELGADLILDYKSSTRDEEIQKFTEEHGGVDIFWETQREPDLPRTIPLMKQRGRIIVMAGRDAQPQFPLGPFYVNDLRLLGFAMFNATPEEQAHCARDLNELFSQQKLEVLIGQTLPLDQAATAHQLQEDNTLQKSGTLSGKIVVTV